MPVQRQHRPPHQPPRPRRTPARPDPWQVAGTDKPQEPGPWLLSYLDVMTLLFSFFVMLFAYQKALNADLARQTARSAALAARPMPRAEGNAGAASPPTAAAIHTMKDQAAVRELARAVSPGRTTGPTEPSAPARPMQLQPALDALSHLGRSMVPDAMAAEQVALQLSSVLRDETAARQVDIQRASGTVRMEVNDSILFDSASAGLRPEGMDLLQRLAPVLARQQGTISVEGHTDPTPIRTAQFPSNWELSAARASAVTRFLLAKGLPAERLRAVGMADTQPRDSNASGEGRARNRRVTIVVIAPGAGAPGGA